jgi:hypothetical protein
MLALRRLWPVFLCVFPAMACDDAPQRALDAGEETSTAPGDDSGQDEPAGDEAQASQDAEALEDAQVEDAEGLHDAEPLDDASAEPAKHDSFETALPLEVGETGVLTDERSAEQVDYFVFGRSRYVLRADDQSRHVQS